ncbi:hypothetical protein, partial [uncultured Croceicoccus sp.]|uniref:hypothetical protein n=1 Tax=uncultured Croceicoccus sp. TaxID=1295329 RepID=UPI002607B5FB
MDKQMVVIRLMVDLPLVPLIVIGPEKIREIVRLDQRRLRLVGMIVGKHRQLSDPARRPAFQLADKLLAHLALSENKAVQRYIAGV